MVRYYSVGKISSPGNKQGYRCRNSPRSGLEADLVSTEPILGIGRLTWVEFGTGTGVGEGSFATFELTPRNIPYEGEANSARLHRSTALGKSGRISDGDKDEKEDLTELHFGIGLGS